MTGRTVLICLVGFFAVVAGVNAVMIRAAVSTFGGVETANAYQAGLAFAREIAAAEAQDALHWQVRAKVAAARRCDAGRGDRARRGGPAARGPARRPRCSRIRPTGAATMSSPLDENAPGTFRGTDDRGDRPVGPRHRAVARRRAAVPLQEPRLPALRVCDGRDARSFDLRAQRDGGTAHMDLAVEGVGCAGCIRKIENGLKQMPGIVDARLNFTNRRLAVEWRDDELDAGDVIRRARAHRLSRASVRARARGSRRGAPGALADEMPGGRGLRGHEHHAAVGLGLVRQRLRHDAGDARPLPLAVGADRAAGGGLCRPAVLPERAAGAPRRGSSTWTCRSRSASCSRSACRWSRPRITPSTPISIPP